MDVVSNDHHVSRLHEFHSNYYATIFVQSVYIAGTKILDFN